jgi:hypothetical protein
LIYVSRTFQWAVPYLKGLHLTINSWREGQDGEGDKVKKPAAKPGHCIVWEWEYECRIDESHDNAGTSPDGAVQ